MLLKLHRGWRHVDVLLYLFLLLSHRLQVLSLELPLYALSIEVKNVLLRAFILQIWMEVRRGAPGRRLVQHHVPVYMLRQRFICDHRLAHWESLA